MESLQLFHRRQLVEKRQLFSQVDIFVTFSPSSEPDFELHLSDNRIQEVKN